MSRRRNERRVIAPTGRREMDQHPKGWRLLLRENWYRDVWLLIISGVVVWALVIAIGHVDDLKREGQERRAQTCVLFERQYRVNVKRLSSTYAYLLKLTPHQARSPLNRAVLSSLPQTEQDAKTSVPPAYCTADRPAIPTRPLELAPGFKFGNSPH